MEKKRIGISCRTRPRAALTGVTALLFLLVSLLTATAPASARENELLDVTCTPPSSNTSVYTPPLTNTPQTVGTTPTIQLGPCVSPSTPGITSGTSVYTGPPKTRTCLALLTAGTATKVVTWNTGATSTLSTNYTVTVAAAVVVVTYTGTVTSGLFAGDTVVMTHTGPATDITLCTLGLGTVPSLFGVVTLEITSV